MFKKSSFYTFNLDMYKDAYFLPSLSENIMYQFSIQRFDEILNTSFQNTVNIQSIYNNNIATKIDCYRRQTSGSKRNVDIS